MCNRNILWEATVTWKLIMRIKQSLKKWPQPSIKTFPISGAQVVFYVQIENVHKSYLMTVAIEQLGISVLSWQLWHIEIVCVDVEDIHL